MATELVRYDAMCSAIAAAYDVDEVKQIRDQAIAIEIYCRQAKNTEAERQACEIRLRAERKAGELRRKEEKAKGFNAASPPPSGGRTATNAERREQLGISKKQDEQWQALAAVPAELFEQALAEWHRLGFGDKPSTNGVLRATTEPKSEPVADEALWLWGRLRDFERNGLLDQEPAAVMRTLTPTMIDEVHRLAPRVATWLRRIGGLDVH